MVEKSSAPNKRLHHLRVPVLDNEKAAIEAKATQAGMSVARYLREAGQGYPIKSVVDLEQVRQMARINGDLGRLGGLLKLWLSDETRINQVGPEPVLALLSKIEATQDEMGKVMASVVMPRQKVK